MSRKPKDPLLAPVSIQGDEVRPASWYFVDPDYVDVHIELPGPHINIRIPRRELERLLRIKK